MIVMRSPSALRSFASRPPLKQAKVQAWRSAGILPILSRIVLSAGATPISVHGAVEYGGAAFFAREDGGDRLFLNMWLEARAQLGKTYGPNLVGEPEVVGRAFADACVAVTVPSGAIDTCAFGGTWIGLLDVLVAEDAGLAVLVETHCLHRGPRFISVYVLRT